MNWFYRLMAWIFGRNLVSTPVEVIRDQLRELRPLPLGMTEFDEWSDRIISGALVTADHESQKFALASMIKMMGPTEDHKEDIFFMKSLRRSAMEQIATAVQHQIRDAAKARLAAQEVELTQKPEMTTPNMTRV